jgi:hypothetical protein
MQRNGQKRDKKIEGKRRQEKSFCFFNFFGQFVLDFPQKGFCGVFELPFLRNAQKRHN